MEEPENKYAIHEAAREGRIQVVESQINANPKSITRADEDGRLPIHWACAYNHLEIVKILISSTPTRNFDPDPPDNLGWTPLMIASSLKDDAGESIIRLLLSKEADPKLVTNTGGTALHFASSKGSLETCKILLSNGASTRTKDKRGQLPLHRAAAVGSVPIVNLLLDHKCPVNTSDVDGMTALHQAISEGHGDVALVLMKRGADIGKRDADERLAIDCAPDAKVRLYILKAAEAEGILVED